MNYVIAVSGGVDSVVLLDMATKGLLEKSDLLVVAHFDHGIRIDSAEDEAFVAALATRYNLPYESKCEVLGQDASEELARDRRYAFLRSIADKYEATLITAHHADDVAETIAINLMRGTGWRGLAVLDSPGIERPLLAMRKSQVIEYALKHRLEWREDSTNRDMKYLRNNLRTRVRRLDDSVIDQLRTYREHQVVLKKKIDTEVRERVGNGPLNRYMFITVSQQIGRELLRRALIAKTDAGATRPQLDRALLAIKTFQPGKRYQVNDLATLCFTKSHFVIE